MPQSELGAKHPNERDDAENKQLKAGRLDGDTLRKVVPNKGATSCPFDLGLHPCPRSSSYPISKQASAGFPVAYGLVALIVDWSLLTDLEDIKRAGVPILRSLKIQFRLLQQALMLDS